MRMSSLGGHRWANNLNGQFRRRLDHRDHTEYVGCGWLGNADICSGKHRRHFPTLGDEFGISTKLINLKN